MLRPPHTHSRSRVPVKMPERKKLDETRSLLGSGYALLKTRLYTLHLFTKADYKTILFPIVSGLVTEICPFLNPSTFRKTVFGCVSGPVRNCESFLRAIVWTWMHLLQCNLSNQYKAKEEDLINKPWRPLPSNRISARGARLLRWTIAFLCIAISIVWGWQLACVSLMLTFTTIVYDEFGGSGHWLGKNMSGVSGYSTFELGSSMLMGKHHSRPPW
jgi:hypothetical protein